jgi:hypothetical protein
VRATLEVINQMQADGIIGKYAIGGAVGATLYLEPAATLDIDIFVVLPTVPGSSLLSLTPIYDYLKARGGKVEDEYVEIGGWPVQFLPLGTELEREAVDQAIATTVDEVPTCVMSPEHLVAIALRTGRSKDYARVMQFLNQKRVNRSKLRDLLERHGLMPQWTRFEQKYLVEGK